jgi:hypothetical protein
MIATGVAPAGADLETYGRVSGQIMDTCGLAGWTRLKTGVEEHRTVVPGCAAYLPLFQHIDAPRNICALPFEWDNGCLDIINAGLEIWPRRCAYAGDSDCHYVIAARQEPGDTSAQAAPLTHGGTPVAVCDEPTWTNPTAGFLALIGAAVEHFGDHALHVLAEAIRQLAARAGQEQLAGRADLPVPAIAGLLRERYAAAGFVGALCRATGDGAVLLDLGANPYRPVLDYFSSARQASALMRTYDDAWARSAPGVRIEVVSDSWIGAASHELKLNAVLGNPP